MTYGECLVKIRKLINYYSIAGRVVSAGDETGRDYTARAASAADSAQKELAGICPLIKSAVYEQLPLRPLAAKSEAFALCGGWYLYAGGAAAFSFLSDGDVTAGLEKYENGEWSRLLTVQHTGTGRLERVSGRLAAQVSAGDKMRLALSGDGAAVSNIGLFSSFPAQEDTPVYCLDRRRTLPEDFGRVYMVTAKPKNGTVRKNAFYNTAEGKIGFPWEFFGRIELMYAVNPPVIDDTTPLTEEIQLPGQAAELIPYYAAALLLSDEDARLSQFFMDMYKERCDELTGPDGVSVLNTLWR